jgi:hypothetical protein
MTGHAVPHWFEPEAVEFARRALSEIEGLSPRALADRAMQLDREEAEFLQRQHGEHGRTQQPDRTG